MYEPFDLLRSGNPRYGLGGYGTEDQVRVKAVLVDYEGEEAWLSKSQLKKDKEGVFVIPLTVKEGWAEDHDR